MEGESFPKTEGGISHVRRTERHDPKTATGLNHDGGVMEREQAMALVLSEPNLTNHGR